jgi:hypothetical protein
MTTRGHEAQLRGGSSPGRTTTPRPSSAAACEVMRHGNDRVCRPSRPFSGRPPSRRRTPPTDIVGDMDAHLELELRKLLAEREIQRQLFDYHEAMNRADYQALNDLLGDAVITVCDAPRHHARVEPLASLRPDQRTAVIHGGEQFVAGCRTTWLTYGGDPRMQFGATNVVVDVEDSLDTATCHSYFFLFQALGPRDHAADQATNPGDQATNPSDQATHVADQLGLDAPSDFPLQVISCGRYFDTYHLIGEKWQIVARQIYPDFAGDASRHMRAPEA